MSKMSELDALNSGLTLNGQPLPSANTFQVGGDHYRRASYQHWDFAAEHGMGYFEGQISKYTTRHRFKKGLEDLEKAQHLGMKLLELANAGQRPIHRGSVFRQDIERYQRANSLTLDEASVVHRCGTWTAPWDLQIILNILARIRRDTYGEPGPGYVSQG